ncbi:DUF86 domain-containing protein [uncultured Adlercreutzia sp.]|uniref:HepT-like ribonuclease domain-containing protein n=1 Tax=uncultured Adlercreutzia sp. TaxID=875803 RepID=UPI002675684C|nr:HepT-like ribonuclease domain-containing protein [uncultured Adlercreutzia sp.]
MRNPDAIECLELMLPLCESVADRIERYGITRENIAENSDYFDLVLMPIFQIGELIGAGGYYDALQELYPAEIWSQAYGLRNRIAHGYAKLDPAIIWVTATKSIPELETLCRELLKSQPSGGENCAS